MRQSLWYCNWDTKDCLSGKFYFPGQKGVYGMHGTWDNGSTLHVLRIDSISNYSIH